MENNIKNEEAILMPVNKKFLDVFKEFMNDEQKTKIRANYVRQYFEGIIDLLLKSEIEKHLGEREEYEDINWKRKIRFIEEKYDQEIAGNIREVFEIGGNGSHFKGRVDEIELQEIINIAIHIVEEIFVKYFLSPEHQFGKENIFTIFSMLPLNNRIYILEKICKNYKNKDIIDRLSLAYFKYGEKDKAMEIIEVALKEKVVDNNFKSNQIEKIEILEKKLSSVQKMNSEYEKDPKYSKAIISEDKMVVGFPTSKDIFETKRAADVFKFWFKESKDKYPEFINLFFGLMAMDKRQYE